MNKNNLMYTMFKEMKQGYANDNSSAVAQCARCWLQCDPENPFAEGTPEYEEFFQMKRCFTIWMRGDIDRKINARRMVEHAKALCALNPKQPYKFDKQADEEEKRLAREAEQARIEKANSVEEINKEENIVKLEEPVHITGVLPDEEKEKEKKSWLQFLFPWRREGE